MKNIILIVVMLVSAVLFSVWIGSNTTVTPDNQTAGNLLDKMGASYPEPTGYVVDAGKVLSQNAFKFLTDELTAFDKYAQVAVVTVNTTSPLSIEEYSIKLADKWKVGYKGLDNGVILLVAVKDRKIRIEVGRGIEDKLTDAEAGRIISNIIAPKLKAGDWDGGITDGAEAIMGEVK